MIQEKISAWTLEVASPFSRRGRVLISEDQISESRISLWRTIDRSAVGVYKLLKHFSPIILAL